MYIHWNIYFILVTRKKNNSLGKSYTRYGLKIPRPKPKVTFKLHVSNTTKTLNLIKQVNNNDWLFITNVTTRNGWC